MPPLIIILGIYSLITVVSVFAFMTYLTASKKQILRYESIRIKLRREIRADLIQTLKPFSLISNKGNNQLWMYAAHQLDIHTQLDQETIHNGEYIISQLFNWATIKQLVDSNQITIDYSATFAMEKISPEASILISALASFYIGSIREQESLQLFIEISNNKVLTRFSMAERNKIPKQSKRIEQKIQEQKGKIIQDKNVIIITFDR